MSLKQDSKPASLTLAVRYTCFARNMYGKAATSCILTVIGDPEKKPQPAKFTRGLIGNSAKQVFTGFL